MNLKYFVFLCFILSPSLNHAQNELRNLFGDLYYPRDLYKAEYQSPDGSPYLNEEFTPAKVNQVKETQLIRLDAVKGRVEIMADNGQVVILRESETHTIRFLNGSNRVFETHQYTNEKGTKKTSFFELVATVADFKIYLKEEKRFLKATRAEAYKPAKPTRFEKTKPSYFIADFKNQSANLLQIPQRSKALTDFFESKGKTIKAFIKKEKLKGEEVSDLVKIFEYYFSLH